MTDCFSRECSNPNDILDSTKMQGQPSPSANWKLADKPKSAPDQRSPDTLRTFTKSLGPTPTARPVHLQLEVRAAVHLESQNLDPHRDDDNDDDGATIAPQTTAPPPRGERGFTPRTTVSKWQRRVRHPTQTPTQTRHQQHNTTSPTQPVTQPRTQHRLELTNPHSQITHRHCAPPLQGHDRLLLHIHPGPHGAAHEHDQIRPHQYATTCLPYLACLPLFGPESLIGWGEEGRR